MSENDRCQDADELDGGWTLELAPRPPLQCGEVAPSPSPPVQTDGDEEGSRE